jgi:hypothetical protein
MKPITKLAIIGVGAAAVFGIGLCLRQPDHPEDEEKLIAMLVSAGHDYDHGDTYTKQDIINQTESAICDEFKGRSIDRWTGTVNERNELPDAIDMTIEINSTIEVEALVDRGEPAFEALRHLNFGDRVEFSGDFDTGINGCPHTGSVLKNDIYKISLPIIPITLSRISKL